MVEMAIVIVLLMMLVFAIIEFSVVLLKWGQTVEATRAGVRYAIVNDPVDSDLFDILSCPGGASVEKNCADVGTNCCGDVDCTIGLLPTMQRMLPTLDAGNVQVTYSCSGASYSERPLPVPLITVRVVEFTHDLIVPTLLGVDAVWALPSFASTRTGEDLDTVGP